MDIKQAIADVISYAYDIAEPKIDKLYHQWEENKKHFIDMLQGQLIYESPEQITFYLPEESKEQLFCDFRDKYEIGDLYYFLEQLEVGDFFNNLTSKDYTVYRAETNIYVNIPKGQKVLKSFKYFIDGDKLKLLQQEASMLIQQNCVTGHLCLSIHPLDYLSISENTFNWRSCHSLDGDYGAGNLEYMADKSTVVCYLKADKNAILPHFPEHIPWNNKKWRCLLFFDDYCEFVMMGRQYPFFTESSLTKITSLLRECGFGIWTKWYNDYLDKFPQQSKDSTHFYMRHALPIGECLVSLEDLLVISESKNFFCDLTQSNIYTCPYYAYNVTDCNPFSQTGWTNVNKTKLHIGQKVLCPECEQLEISYGDLAKCIRCNTGIKRRETCEYCQQPLNSFVYFVETSYVCQHCYDTKTQECSRCHSRVFTKHISYLPRHDQYICDWCMRDIQEVKENERRSS